MHLSKFKINQGKLMKVISYSIKHMCVYQSL